MAHTKQILDSISNPLIRAEVEYQVNAPLPRMGTSYLPCMDIDPDHLGVLTLGVSRDPRGYTLEGLFNDVQDYKKERLIRGSHFVLNQSAGLADECPFPKYDEDGRPVFDYAAVKFHNEVEDLGMRAHDLKKELWLAGCHANTLIHDVYQENPARVVMQSVLFVPHDRPQRNFQTGALEICDNRAQVRPFISFLVRKGFIELPRDEKEFLRAFGPDYLFHAQREQETSLQLELRQ